MAENEAEVLALHQTRAGGERIKELVSGSAVSRLIGLDSDVHDYEAKALKTQPEVLLIEFGKQSDEISVLLDKLHRALPRALLVGYSDTRDPDLILSALRAGASEYLVEPATSKELNEAILRRRSQAHIATQASGVLVAVMGAKGGVGASQVAINLAWDFSQTQGERTALVDLDLFGGDLAFLLDLEPKRTMADVAMNFERLDNVMMDSLLADVAPGLRLLAAPPDPVTAEDVTTEHVERGLGHLLDAYGLVVVDLPSRIDEPTLLALDRANLIVLVMEPTLVGLKAARRTVALSQQLGHESEKLQLVVNRFGSKGSLGKADVRKVMTRDVIGWLPNDSRTVLAAGNSGRPVLRDWPKSPWAKSVAKLGAALTDMVNSQKAEIEEAKEG